MGDRENAKLVDISEISSLRNSGISVCIIARDESHCIADALSSARDLADELIVVDTGSQDDTFSVAKQFGAKTYCARWQCDFSQARNFALSRASCKWIFVLDADEAISHEDALRIRDLISRGREVAYVFEQRTYVSDGSDLGCKAADPGDPMSRGSSFFSDRQIRLFPNKPFIRYACEIHENPDSSIISSGIAIEETGIPVHHYGRLLGSSRAQRKALVWLAMGREMSDAFPAHPFYLYEMALQFIALGNPQAAARHLNLILEIDSCSWRPWNAYGLLRIGERNYRSALDCFRKALRISGPNVQVLNNIAVTLMKTGENAEALAYLESALELDGQDADLLRNAAAACAGVGDIEIGCDYIARSIEIDPFVASSHVIQADLFLRKGDKEGAARALDRMRFLAHIPLDARLKSIRLYLGLNLLEEADAMASSALESFPGVPDILYLSGKIAELRGDSTRAEALYRRARSEKPKDTGILSSLGCLYERKGKLSEALAVFREASRMDPEDTRIHINIGIVLDKLGMLDEAEKSFEVALAKGERSGFAYNALGCHYARSNRLELAIECFEKAVEIEAENPAYQRNLAIACEKMHCFSKAARAYERLASLDAAMANYARERLSYLLSVEPATSLR